MAEDTHPPAEEILPPVAAPRDDGETLDGEELSIEDDDVSLDGEELSLDDDDVSLDGEELSIEDDDISLDGEELSIEDDDVSLDGDEVSIEEDDVSLDGEELSIEEDDVSLDGDELSIEEDDVSPEGDASLDVVEVSFDGDITQEDAQVSLDPDAVPEDEGAEEQGDSAVAIELDGDALGVEPPETDDGAVGSEVSADHGGSLADLLDDADEAIAAVEPSAQEEGFDLAAELDGDAEEPQTTVGFDDVFSAFKKGIQEQVGEEESETHYDLAIAYKEMGLLEDAVRELETVQRAGGRPVETFALLAACELELGKPLEAAEHLEQALGLAGDSDDQSVSLRYDLGDALLAAGETGAALEAFEKVCAKDPDFRDVQERIADLS
jgi:hypothetical protein